MLKDVGAQLLCLRAERLPLELLDWVWFEQVKLPEGTVSPECSTPQQGCARKLDNRPELIPAALFPPCLPNNNNLVQVSVVRRI